MQPFESCTECPIEHEMRKAWAQNRRISVVGCEGTTNPAVTSPPCLEMGSEDIFNGVPQSQINIANNSRADLYVAERSAETTICASG